MTTIFGIVRHVPGSYPEWVGCSRHTRETAERIAREFNDSQLRSRILRWPSGTRYYAVKDGSANEVHLQFNRIMEERAMIQRIMEVR